MLDRRYKTLSILATTLSYTKTAQRLFITQPAVSQQISSLEQDLDIKLVTKNGPRIQITDAGTQLVQYVDRVSLENQNVLQRLKTNSNEQTIKIGSTYSLSIFLLPELIKNLLPSNTKIQTIIDNTDQVLAALRQGKIEFGIVEGNFDKNEFDAITIRNEDFIGVANPVNTISTQKELTVTDLLNETLLIRESGSGTRDIFANWLATQNYQLDDFNRQVEIANPTAIIQLLKNNVGISFMYRSLVINELANGTLTQLSVGGFKISHPINIIFLKNSYFTKDYAVIAAKLTK
ncbi:LysR family transcriptional regulator [Paucilactobacillus kaifaensis]|uniref:LysR family transcriptional regulator n=1 Tax=Paucilactobacillus kaifaensis TaxID=2559921 RepID=UPI0010F56F81|nr:LysR family transcriptional regulator [Paucilactobacillus kaifaensis]